MVTVGFGINYNGFVQLNHASYPKGIRLREPGFAMKPVSSQTTSGGRSSANDNCNSCHGQLGVKPSFHSGARNNGAGCAFCHTPDTATGHTGPGERLRWRLVGECQEPDSRHPRFGDADARLHLRGDCREPRTASPRSRTRAC